MYYYKLTIQKFNEKYSLGLCFPCRGIGLGGMGAKGHVSEC